MVAKKSCIARKEEFFMVVVERTKCNVTLIEHPIGRYQQLGRYLHSKFEEDFVQPTGPQLPVAERQKDWALFGFRSILLETHHSFPNLKSQTFALLNPLNCVNAKNSHLSHKPLPNAISSLNILISSYSAESSSSSHYPPS
jgi:hypothetical protein